jgi:hypothetical protein
VVVEFLKGVVGGDGTQSRICILLVYDKKGGAVKGERHAILKKIKTVFQDEIIHSSATDR